MLSPPPPALRIHGPSASLSLAGPVTAVPSTLRTRTPYSGRQYLPRKAKPVRAERARAVPGAISGRSLKPLVASNCNLKSSTYSRSMYPRSVNRYAGKLFGSRVIYRAAARFFCKMARERPNLSPKANNVLRTPSTTVRSNVYCTSFRSEGTYSGRRDDRISPDKGPT